MKKHLQDLGPYRGSQPHSNQLLILNESFYLEDRDKEIDPEAWYSKGTAMLDSCEQTYINYEKIFRINKRPDGSWENRGCTIYRNIESALTEAGFPEIHNMLDHCTIANCFLRPAVNGESLVLTPRDIDESKEYIAEIVAELRPRTIICASSKAFKKVVKHLSFDARVVEVHHPACPWWNRDEGKHGRVKFIEAVKEHLAAAG